MSSLSASVTPQLTLIIYLDLDNSWPNEPLRANYVKAVKEHNKKLDNKITLDLICISPNFLKWTAILIF